MILRVAALVMAGLIPTAAWAADDADSEGRPDEIVVFGRGLQQVGVASSGSEGVVGYADFENRPISRIGELAENVPGLIATQHSGTGKANQFFLRGFNLDHGTDLAAFVDGAPVNMRSHGHGQGYLDLNFLIPELVERIDYTKGPYHAEQGDFGSAGSMAFTTKVRLESPLAEVTSGSFGYWRGLLAGSAAVGAGTLLAGLDGTISDGPWVLDERLRKVNGLVKYSAGAWSAGLAGYASRWTSTDQVPQRAITTGLIPRNGFIDPDLGGRTGRIALTVNGAFGDTKVTAYAIGSRLELTSNFTYFLNDPVHGDAFRQIDRRGVFGGSVRQQFRSALGRAEVTWRLGGDLRYDRIGQVGLYRVMAGTTAGTIRQDRVDEYSGALFGEAQIALSPALRLVLGLRGDAIGYRVRSGLAANSGSGSAGVASPKAALAWKAADGIEFYANYGEGYHSNDVRGATITTDPVSGDPVGHVPVIARSRGGELGARIERGGLSAALVGFWLDLASELVFVGDAGTTEANGATRRQGAELSVFWKPNHWLAIDGAAALTRARFRNGPQGQDRVPGATPLVIGGGVNARLSDRLAATVRLRHFGGAALTEDGAHTAPATTLVNFGAYWAEGPLRIGVDVLNALGARANDISYFYASRLPGEPAEGVDDVHFHPVEPRQVRVSVRRTF